MIEKMARLPAPESSAAWVRWTFAHGGHFPRSTVRTDYRARGPGSVSWQSHCPGAHPRIPDRKSQGCGQHCRLPKHFVRAWRGEGGWDYNSAKSLITLREVYLPAFYAALDEGAVKIKSSFNALNGVQATANLFALTEILRKEMGVPRPGGNRLWRDERMIPNGIANDGETADRKAFLAGVDIDMESNLYCEYLLVKSGKVRETQLDESVRRGYKTRSGQ